MKIQSKIMIIFIGILCINLVNAAEGDYIDSIDVSGEVASCYGVTTDGSDIYVADKDDDELHKYSMAMVYESVSFTSSVVDLHGMTNNGTYFYLSSWSSDEINKNYFTNGTHHSNFSTSVNVDTPAGACFNETSLYILDANGYALEKYSDAGSHIAEQFSLSAKSRYGVACYGDYFYFLQTGQYAAENYIDKHYANGTLAERFNISDHITTIRDIEVYGDYIYVCDRDSDDVHRFEGPGFPLTEFTMDLISPTNNTALSTTGTNFTANYNITGANAEGYNFTNTTYYLWNSTGIFNNSVIVNITGISNSTTEYINNFILENYEWNVWACWGNVTFSNCSFADANYSVSLGSTLISISFNNHTYETASETFMADFNILEDAEISLAQLVYNGTNYTISDITTTTTSFNISKTIDMPPNLNPFTNETKSFFFRFTYEGDQVQETKTYYQNISIINLQLCNATYNTLSLNFSLRDEITKSLIDPSTNNTNLQVTFEYWLGGGTAVKNYSLERLSSATNNTYEFCIFPNKTYKVNMDMVYSAQAYDERNYILRNASITNVTSVIDLFLLFENLATKFTVEVRQGVSILTDAVVTVARFFIGEGAYRTISIRETDAAGQFIEYLDLDNDYRYSIVKDGALLGVIDKKATCTEAPCEFTLQIAEDVGNLYAGLEEHFASGVLTNMSFNISTKIFTYDFIDITGLAQYFRLRVTRGMYNGTGTEICNQQTFSSSGSMTCNVTGYEGNFVAVGTVSRSPELITDILETALDVLRDSLGLMAIFISFAIILTITLAGGVLSGGNPSMVLGGFGLGLLATKLMTLLPFSWGLVALFELVLLVIMGWLKT